MRHGHGPERSIQTGIGPVPVLYLRGVSTGDFQEALAGLPGFRLTSSNNVSIAQQAWQNRQAHLLLSLIIGTVLIKVSAATAGGKLA